ncbi:hypothetical protein KIN20_016203 [Parelaphostrongylus tenuis]|uniref:Uncharacterized protein n=1 Tax=Parelaphostrongylus tenuis TaxID=148309 RepID=A0AAD5N507_PARTN|nr:hypothetical protein KIN20_016203 [Parelaphostrongylus tenuis]
MVSHSFFIKTLQKKKFQPPLQSSASSESAVPVKKVKKEAVERKPPMAKQNISSQASALVKQDLVQGDKKANKKGGEEKPDIRKKKSGDGVLSSDIF